MRASAHMLGNASSVKQAHTCRCIGRRRTGCAEISTHCCTGFNLVRLSFLCIRVLLHLPFRVYSGCCPACRSAGTAEEPLILQRYVTNPLTVQVGGKGQGQGGWGRQRVWRQNGVFFRGWPWILPSPAVIRFCPFSACRVTSLTCACMCWSPALTP